MEITGTILRGREFEPVRGRVVVEDGEIAAVEEADVRGSKVILPAFVNAHTHIGDSIAKEAGEGLSMPELVAPPDGLKHRLLREASREELVEGMRRTLHHMQDSGTAACIDFREGGLDGVTAIEEAAEGLGIEPVILGRETAEAMERGDGFGASGANDADFSGKRLATREAGKPFGIHAGEGDASDINPALDLDPDFLVHMVHPERLHLERLADLDIPVVVCLRANLVTGVGTPPVEELHERTKLAIGTDNVMLNGPSMFRELEFLSKLTELESAELLRMATINGAEIAGRDYGLVEEGRPAKLQILDGDSDNLVGAQNLRRAVVRRAGKSDIEDVVL